MLFINNIQNIHLRGQGDAVIVCKGNFYFYFYQINGTIEVLNLHLKNCTGKVIKQHKITSFFHSNSAIQIKLNNISILNEFGPAVGIMISPENTSSYSVDLSNYFLSTGGTGFHSEGFIKDSTSYSPRIDISRNTVQIRNSIFFASCLEIKTPALYSANVHHYSHLILLKLYVKMLI